MIKTKTGSVLLGVGALVVLGGCRPHRMTTEPEPSPAAEQTTQRERSQAAAPTSEIGRDLGPSSGGPSAAVNATASHSQDRQSVVSQEADPKGDRAEYPLWAGRAPGSETVELVEQVTDRDGDSGFSDRRVHSILRPTLTAFVPKQPNGTSLLIAPGGGYVREVLDRESFEIASWLAERGVTGFVLKYRLPAEGHQRGSDVPLQDAQRALRLIRSWAERWKLDSQRIGVLGFSAGGHLAASLSTRFNAVVYRASDEVDRISARPDFSILLYPVISMQASIAHAGSRRALLGANPGADLVSLHSLDRQVTAATPPTLIILADDDRSVVPENAVRYYRALHAAGVSAELHVYAAGGHGFGIRGARALPVADWPSLTWAWLSDRGMVGAPRD